MRLDRLLNPKTIVVIGGGAWCKAIIGAARQLGFSGNIIPVHPSAKFIAELPTVHHVQEIEAPIDAAFIGINRHATIETVSALKTLNAGGAVCFASGFSEASAELSDGTDLQRALLDAAQDMPILGPNCYGILNALDGAALWPDQHGLKPVESGVALLTQSSNIAINLTMQTRGLPIAMVITCGNQAQLDQASIAMDLLDDDRITAIGLHIEGIGNIANWEALAAKAHLRGKPIVVLKVGQSMQAQAATVSHTASLAGRHDAAQAFFRRLGFAQVETLPLLLETLSLLHTIGPLQSLKIASISCSGGEAALVSDAADRHGLVLPPLNPAQRETLSQTLGPKVALANPLDYHTYIWRDQEAMTATWSAMAHPDTALTLIVVDYPRPDICDLSDWEFATQAAIAAKQRTGRPVAVVSTLAETFPEAIADQLRLSGVAALHGVDDALCAIKAANSIAPPHPLPCCKPHSAKAALLLDEGTAKQKLAAVGLTVPQSKIVSNPPKRWVFSKSVAVKGLGHAHKSEQGLIALDIQSLEALNKAMSRMNATEFLIEEMIIDGVAELLVGIQNDPAFGMVMTLGAGGVLTELWKDTVTLLLPATDSDIRNSLETLKTSQLLEGYRGAPPANMDAVIGAIQSICAYALANPSKVAEVEVNPLICTPTRAVAVDALIREST